MTDEEMSGLKLRMSTRNYVKTQRLLKSIIELNITARLFKRSKSKRLKSGRLMKIVKNIDAAKLSNM